MIREFSPDIVYAQPNEGSQQASVPTDKRVQEILNEAKKTAEQNTPEDKESLLTTVSQSLHRFTKDLKNDEEERIIAHEFVTAIESLQSNNDVEKKDELYGLFKTYNLSNTVTFRRFINGWKEAHGVYHSEDTTNTQGNKSIELYPLALLARAAGIPIKKLAITNSQYDPFAGTGIMQTQKEKKKGLSAQEKRSTEKNLVQHIQLVKKNFSDLLGSLVERRDTLMTNDQKNFARALQKMFVNGINEKIGKITLSDKLTSYEADSHVSLVENTYKKMKYPGIATLINTSGNQSFMKAREVLNSHNKDIDQYLGSHDNLDGFIVTLKKLNEWIDAKLRSQYTNSLDSLRIALTNKKFQEVMAIGNMSSAVKSRRDISAKKLVSNAKRERREAVVTQIQAYYEEIVEGKKGGIASGENFFKTIFNTLNLPASTRLKNADVTKSYLDEQDAPALNTLVTDDLASSIDIQQSVESREGHEDTIKHLRKEVDTISSDFRDLKAHEGMSLYMAFESDVQKDIPITPKIFSAIKKLNRSVDTFSDRLGAFTHKVDANAIGELGEALIEATQYINEDPVLLPSDKHRVLRDIDVIKNIADRLLNEIENVGQKLMEYKKTDKFKDFVTQTMSTSIDRQGNTESSDQKSDRKWFTHIDKVNTTDAPMPEAYENVQTMLAELTTRDNIGEVLVEEMEAFADEPQVSLQIEHIKEAFASADEQTAKQWLSEVTQAINNGEGLLAMLSSNPIARASLVIGGALNSGGALTTDMNDQPKPMGIKELWTTGRVATGAAALLAAGFTVSSLFVTRSGLQDTPIISLEWLREMLQSIPGVDNLSIGDVSNIQALTISGGVAALIYYYRSQNWAKLSKTGRAIFMSAVIASGYFWVSGIVHSAKDTPKIQKISQKIKADLATLGAAMTSTSKTITKLIPHKERGMEVKGRAAEIVQQKIDEETNNKKKPGYGNDALTNSMVLSGDPQIARHDDYMNGTGRKKGAMSDKEKIAYIKKRAERIDIIKSVQERYPDLSQGVTQWLKSKTSQFDFMHAQNTYDTTVSATDIEAKKTRWDHVASSFSPAGKSTPETVFAMRKDAIKAFMAPVAEYDSFRTKELPKLLQYLSDINTATGVDMTSVANDIRQKFPPLPMGKEKLAELLAITLEQYLKGGQSAASAQGSAVTAKDLLTTPLAPQSGGMTLPVRRPDPESIMNTIPDTPVAVAPIVITGKDVSILKNITQRFIPTAETLKAMDMDMADFFAFLGFLSLIAGLQDLLPKPAQDAARHRRERLLRDSLTASYEDISDIEEEITSKVVPFVQSTLRTFERLAFGDAVGGITDFAPDDVVALDVRARLRDVLMQNIALTEAEQNLLNGDAFDIDLAKNTLHTYHDALLVFNAKLQENPHEQAAALATGIYPSIADAAKAIPALLNPDESITSRTEREMQRMYKKLRNEIAVQSNGTLHHMLDKVNMTEDALHHAHGDALQEETVHNEILLDPNQPNFAIPRETSLHSFALATNRGDADYIQDRIKVIHAITKEIEGIPEGQQKRYTVQEAMATFLADARYKDFIPKIQPISGELSVEDENIITEDFAQFDAYMSTLNTELEPFLDGLAQETAYADYEPKLSWKRHPERNYYTLHVGMRRKDTQEASIGGIYYNVPIPSFDTQTPKGVAGDVQKWFSKGSDAERGLIAQVRHAEYLTQRDTVTNTLQDLLPDNLSVSAIPLIGGDNNRAISDGAYIELTDLYRLNAIIKDQSSLLGHAEVGAHIEEQKYQRFINPDDVVSAYGRKDLTSVLLDIKETVGNQEGVHVDYDALSQKVSLYTTTDSVQTIPIGEYTTNLLVQKLAVIQ